MRISYSTLRDNLERTKGYGVAGYGLFTTLLKLGHQVEFQDPKAEVEINFVQPDLAQWTNPKAYKIIYTPWESSSLQPGWKNIFNKADEVWTTSDLIADWYRAGGVTKPIHVLYHGIDEEWQPQKRSSQSKIKFLNVGSPAVRKCTQETLDAFVAAFGDREDVSLTIKSYGSTGARGYVQGKAANPDRAYRNVRLITRQYSIEEMYNLYYDHHAMIYASQGEGFGLIPFQAIGSGMPTITNPVWAPFEHYVNEDLAVSSKLVDSPWPKLHPGKMFKPNFDEMVDNYRLVADNFDFYAKDAMLSAEGLHQEFSWENVVKDTFDSLEKRLENR